jgi:hypothetical protein
VEGVLVYRNWVSRGLEEKHIQVADLGVEKRSLIAGKKEIDRGKRLATGRMVKTS